MKFSRHNYTRQEQGFILLRVLIFSISLVLVFTLVANKLPQIEGEAPQDEDIEIGTLTMEQFVSLGESLFNGKGTCTLCHNKMGRAPDLLAMDVAATAAERLQDERYQGQATSVESYLRESMLEPSTYVVSGFGKKGSNDSVSPMPVINKAPIGLSDIEIDALIAFLQAKNSHEVTVSLPQDSPAPVEAAAPVAQTAAAEPVTAKSAEEVITENFCQACHNLMGSESSIGPDLNSVGSRLSPEEIRQSIIDPNTVIAEGFPQGIMPQDFADKMTIRELEMLVRYLSEKKE